MKDLIGKIVLGLQINEDQSFLVFETNKGRIAYKAQGDCCSESWFADITGVRALIGGTVTSVEEVNMDGYNVTDGRTRQESDEAYGYKLTTDKGYADIVFRNSSNGYYGGWIDQFAVIGELSEGMTEITDDWSA